MRRVMVLFSSLSGAILSLSSGELRTAELPMLFQVPRFQRARRGQPARSAHAKSPRPGNKKAAPESPGRP
jgi:hypothetical protein